MVGGNPSSQLRHTSSTAGLPRAERHADHCLGAHSTARGLVLSFLPVRGLKAASRISESWFVAASVPHVWASAVELHYARHALTAPMLPAWYPQLTMPFQFEHPGVFSAVLAALVQYHDTLKSMLDDDEFYKVVGQTFGALTSRFVVQYPLLLLMLHTPAFLALKADTCARDDYVERRRFLLLIANVVRWHESYPNVGGVPWLLELYRWGSFYAPLPFDSLLLTPALSLLRQHAVGSVPLCEAVVLDIVASTARYLRRYLSADALFVAVTKGGVAAAPPPAAVSPTSQVAPAMPTSGVGSGGAPSDRTANRRVHPLQLFSEERELFRVVVTVLELFRTNPHIRQATADAVAPYGPTGIEEMIQCKARLDTFRVVKHVVLAEKKAMPRGGSH